MKVINRTKGAYTFDRVAYERFLRELGIPEEKIAILTVSLCDGPLKQIEKWEAQLDDGHQVYGQYGAWHIYVFIRDGNVVHGNSSLVHETSHFMDECEIARQREEAAKTMTPAKYQKFWDVLQFQRMQEMHIPYDQRPSEARARVLAGTHRIQVIKPREVEVAC